jgi:hypothetical protein
MADHHDVAVAGSGPDRGTLTYALGDAGRPDAVVPA